MSCNFLPWKCVDWNLSVKEIRERYVVWPTIKFSFYELISYAQSYQETWNCTFSLQHAKKSVRTDLQQSLSLVICSTFELLHCWILQKLSSNGFFVTLQKFYHILATIQFYIQTIILVNLKGWDSFCYILTPRLKFKSFAIVNAWR